MQYLRFRGLFFPYAGMEFGSKYVFVKTEEEEETFADDEVASGLRNIDVGVTSIGEGQVKLISKPSCKVTSGLPTLAER